MKTLGRQTPQCAKITPLVAGKQPMGIVFDNCHSAPLRNLANRVHLAAYPRIMHRDDRFGPVADQSLQTLLIEIQSVGTDV